jgi:hypothetical protein
LPRQGQVTALDFTVVSPLKMEIFSGAGAAENRGMVAVESAEAKKRVDNREVCAIEAWKCVPMAVDSYGVWGTEAREMISSVARDLSIQLSMSKSKAVCFIYNTLGVVLARQNAIAILSKLPHDIGKSDVALLGEGGSEDDARSSAPSPVPVSYVDQAQEPYRSAVRGMDDSPFGMDGLDLGADTPEPICGSDTVPVARITPGQSETRRTERETDFSDQAHCSCPCPPGEPCRKFRAPVFDSVLVPGRAQALSALGADWLRPLSGGAGTRLPLYHTDPFALPSPFTRFTSA